MPRDIERDELLEAFFRRVPPEMAQTFTAEQLEAVRRAFAPARHAVDLRTSIPLVGLRFYLVLLVGRERRSRERRREERLRRPLWTPANAAVLGSFSALLVLSLLGLATLAAG